MPALARPSSNDPTANSLGVPAIVDPTTNKIIKRGRLKSPADLVSAWQTFWWSDLESAQFRTRAQAWRDGEPPYSTRKEALMGTAGRTNVNWGIGDQIASDAEMPYNDILDGLDTLFSMPTRWGTSSDRIYTEQVMAEEITRMLRGWSQFDPLYQLNVRLFVDEGVSFAFFEDDFCWKWDIVGLQNLVFPRRVRADVNQLDIVLSKRQLLPYKLYEKCANEDLSASEGWNRDATWEAIKTAAQPTLQANDWQQWETAWKNHDYVLGDTAITVEVIEGWVREVDGSVSHYLARSDGEGDFLYKKEGKYNDLSHMLVPFLYGVGSNGTFHAIHGVLQKTFAAGMAQNKVFCRALDMAIHASTPYLQCTTEESLQELPLTPMGQYVAMAPGYGWAETKVPPFAEGLYPLLEQLNGFLRARTQPYGKTAGTLESKTPRTAREIQSNDEIQARLSSSGVTLFKNGLRMLYQEVVRRVIQMPYPQSWVGGAEVQEFIARCNDRGVPTEAIRAVDWKRIEPNMGIGRGSAAARRVSADALNTLYPRGDAKAQNYINYMVAAAYTDAETARNVFPFEPGLRPPPDVEAANNENSAITSMAALQMPQTVAVLPNQNHAIHIESHATALGNLNAMLEPDQTTGQTMAPLSKVIPIMEPLLSHAEDHLQMLDVTSQNKGMYEDMLKKFRMVVTNGARQLYAEQQKMAKEIAHNGFAGVNGENSNGSVNGAGGPEVGQPQPSSALLVQSAKAGGELENLKVKRDLAVSKHEREQARADAKTAAEIQVMGAKALQNRQGPLTP